MGSSWLTFALLAAFVALAFGQNGFPKEKFMYKQMPSENGVEMYELTDEQDTPDANAYMDEVYAKAKEYMDKTGLNEVPLPDKLLTFNKTIFGKVFKGKFGLENGFIRGLDSIHRTGNCSIKTDGNDIYITAISGITNTKLGYSTILQVNSESLKGSVAGTVDQASARNDLYVYDRKNVTLIYFHLLEIGNISIDITGLGPFNFLAELLSDWVVKMVKSDIPRTCDGPIKGELQTVIDDIPISDLFPNTTAY